MSTLGGNDLSRRLRSHDWFVGNDLAGYAARNVMRSTGVAEDVLDGRPVIGIANSWSEVAHCNVHLRDLADHVKRGVWRAGGYPLEFPAMSLSEPLAKPTTMLYRNLLAMEVEENIRSLPFDGVVLLSSCDKTTPGMLMGAASADVPTICLTGGPMIRGMYGSTELAAGTDTWRYWEELQAGSITQDQWDDLQGCALRSSGHCQVMGTASTMAIAIEALGMMLPGGAAIPAIDSRRKALADATGQRIVAMAHAGPTPSEVMTRKAFENAIRVVMAVGGSTNAVVHLVALAGRVGVPLPLDLFDSIAAETPLLCNVRPSGTKLMEDLHNAGGEEAVIHELLGDLHGDALTVLGQDVATTFGTARVRDRSVIASRAEPFREPPAMVILQGNLCPDGAVLKTSAASPELLQHRGRAIVFEGQRDLLDRVNDPDLDVDETSVIILRGAGPVGGPGMPEWGHIPIPRVLLQRGVRDIVRISDGRMSGTAYGTCILHVAPESAIGGPLALVQDGDEIELDVAQRRLTLWVDEAELAERRARWQAPEPVFTRGYGQLYVQHVTQASSGVDFDFLVGGPGVDLAPYVPNRASDPAARPSNPTAPNTG